MDHMGVVHRIELGDFRSSCSRALIPCLTSQDKHGNLDSFVTLPLPLPPMPDGIRLLHVIVSKGRTKQIILDSFFLEWHGFPGPA